MEIRTLFSEDFYDSASRRHPLSDEFMALLRYRELIKQFISRSLKTRYKRSILGVVWTLLNPLLTMIILTLVFSNLFGLRDTPRYPAYILAGLTAWMFFSSATHGAMGDMVWSSSLLHRIYVPKSVFAVAAVGTSLVNLLISLIPLFLISVAIGVKLKLAVLVMPLAILLLALFALGLGLFLSAAAVFFADILPVYDVFLTLWMYSTPIIYPLSIIPPQYVWLFKLNPMYYLVELFRAPLYEGIIPGWETWVIGASISLVTFVLGGLIFTAKTNEYAYRV